MSKYKINKNFEPLSKQDIDSNMNFDKFYSGIPAAGAGWFGASGKLYLAATLAVATIAAVSYFYIAGKNGSDNNYEAFISPPIKELDIAPDAFIVNSDRDTTINYRSGTTIFIPANIFKTKEGKDVKGPIEIRYREFHDQVDQIFSGIPMNYDSANVHSQFESAGMFDIMAFQDGEPLELKDKKELKVDLISYSDENSYNVYYLDTVQKKWLYDAKNTKQGREELSNVLANFKSDKTILNNPVFVAPRKANPNLNNFTIDYNKDEFPELAVYDGVKFEVENTEKNYDPKLASQTWEDIAITRYSDNAHYVITIKTGKKSNSFVASPVFDAKDFDAAYKAYEQKRQVHLKQIAKQADSLAKLDKQYSYDAKFANDNDNARFQTYVQRGWLYRAIVVRRLGIWNWDCPIADVELAGYKKNQKNKENFCSAHFWSKESNEELKVTKVFLFNRNKKAVFPVSEAEFNSFPGNFAMSSEIVVAFTTDKKVFYIMDDALQSTGYEGNKEYSDNVINYKMNEIKNLKITADEAKAHGYSTIRSALRI